jgi:hypothetical protein
MFCNSFSETGVFLLGPSPRFSSLFDPSSLFRSLFKQLRRDIRRRRYELRLDHFLPLVIRALEADIRRGRGRSIAPRTLHGQAHSLLFSSLVYS